MVSGRDSRGSGAGGYIELGTNSSHVIGDSTPPYTERGGDLLIRPSDHEQTQDLSFPGGQFIRSWRGTLRAGWHHGCHKRGRIDNRLLERGDRAGCPRRGETLFPERDAGRSECLFMVVYLEQ